jgi:type I site-specific restriction-modification system R (restriction) subunit
MRKISRINNIFWYTKDGYIQTMGALKECLNDLYDDFSRENRIKEESARGKKIQVQFIES